MTISLLGANFGGQLGGQGGESSVHASSPSKLRGTGDLGVIIERASGSVQIIETTGHSSLARIEGLGDLSHASVVFSRDQRFAYVFEIGRAHV